MEAGERLCLAPTKKRNREEQRAKLTWNQSRCLLGVAGCCGSFSTPLIHEELQTLLIRLQVIFPNRDYSTDRPMSPDWTPLMVNRCTCHNLAGAGPLLRVVISHLLLLVMNNNYVCVCKCVKKQSTDPNEGNTPAENSCQTGAHRIGTHPCPTWPGGAGVCEPQSSLGKD